MKFIPPMRDFMFKQMFSLEKNAAVLQNFLETYIDFRGKNLTQIRLLDKEIKKYSNDKDNFLDLRVLAGGIEIDVEIQDKRIVGNRDRFCTYLSKMFSEQSDAKVDYVKMHKCISLLILNYKLPECDEIEKFCHTVRLRHDNGVDFYRKMEFQVIELPKIRNIELKQGLSDQVIWAKLFAASSEEELDMINSVTTNQSVHQAVLTIKELNADEKMRLAERTKREAERMARASELTDKLKSKLKGRKEGIAEERARAEAEKAQIIANMKAMGLSEDQINSIMNTNNKQPSEDNSKAEYNELDEYGEFNEDDEYEDAYDEDENEDFEQ